MANNIYESYYISKYTLPNFAVIEIESIYINSKINLFEKKINEIESKIDEIKHNISLFDLSLNNLQSMF